MPELCQWVINIHYLVARLRQIYSKPASRFICMEKNTLPQPCSWSAAEQQQTCRKLATGFAARPFFGK